MPFLIATAPGRADRPNEDFAAVSAHCAVLLDGVTGPPDGGGGCSHGVARHVRWLGGLLLAGLDAGRPPRAALAEAIAGAAALHADTCDLADRRTPSATVVAVRATPGPGRGAPSGADGGAGRLEYLVLSDSVLLVADPGPLPDAADPRGCALRAADGVGVVADTRLDALRADLLRRGAPAGALEALRGVPGGFWTAGSDPRAAEEALTGTVRLDRFALMTDGATRAVEVFGDLNWGQALSLVSDKGPGALIDRVRALEDADPRGSGYPRGKVRDDATVVSWAPENLVH
ncbi:hypothetical protein SAMN05421803_10925 [Nocardiopsis flavescens]|uniref:Protein phosphatase 2C n=1 Tax=Nocardiopsis flavescens TaxID=758803 RepID=A0A1M6LR21_9ACTN|nr:hypothetical protein [Nocardiopsis flavescens]SHJ73635.1 hypothetical protein SAMN05421803_10925 [Nocardiopsis flavescens]